MPEEILLDVCGLEPPEPFEQATEMLRILQPGQYLKLIIPRRPHLLYPWLAEQGFLEHTREARDDLFEIYIWRETDRSCAGLITGMLSA